MTKIRVTNNDWKTKPVAIKNKTTDEKRILKNGVVIYTWNAMLQRAAKI